MKLKKVKAILERPHDAGQWSLQGLGMLRLYLSDSQRLHVWDNDLAFPSVAGSSIHDHPWDFESRVLSGYITNRRYQRVVAGGFECNQLTIRCGPGGGPAEESRPARLRPLGLEHVSSVAPYNTYSQRADEIHQTEAETGTVTLVTRTFKDDRDHARVYWTGDRWVSAEPRPATHDEVAQACDYALYCWRP